MAPLRPPTYRFKHALIQDAAYESLLRSRRQALHRRAAETLRDAEAPSPKRSPIILLRPVSTIWPSNGGARRATRRCAARPSRRRSPISARRSPWRTRRRAAAHAERRRRDQTLKLQVALGNALMTVAWQGAPEAQAAFAEPRELAPARATTPGTIRGRLMASGLAATFAANCAQCESMPRPSCATSRQPDSPEAVVAHRACRITALVRGRFRRRAPPSGTSAGDFQSEPGQRSGLRFGMTPALQRWATCATLGRWVRSTARASFSRT